MNRLKKTLEVVVVGILIAFFVTLFVVLAMNGCPWGPEETWLITWADKRTQEVTYKYCEVNTYVTEKGFLGGAAAVGGRMVFVECYSCDGGLGPVFATQALIAERIQ